MDDSALYLGAMMRGMPSPDGLSPPTAPRYAAMEIKAKGAMTKNPWKEAFLSANIKFVLIATIVVIGEGVVWYSGQFWALYFLQQVSKVDPLTSAYIVGGGLINGTPTLVLFGWLSDNIGRKPVILAGFLLAAVTYYPLHSWLGTVTQPGNVNYPIAIIIVGILVAYVGMVYGPIGAFLAEYFPAKIRYTSVSVPYHIGNGWGGGLVPFITVAAYQATGSLGYALIYPIAVPAVCFLSPRAVIGPGARFLEFLFTGTPRRRRNPGGGDGTVASTMLRSRRSQRDGGCLPTPCIRWQGHD